MCAPKRRLSHEAYTAGVMELATQVSNLPGADAPSCRVLEEGTVVRAFEVGPVGQMLGGESQGRPDVGRTRHRMPLAFSLVCPSKGR